MAKIRIAGEVFSGYNKPKRDKQGGKKFAVAAKEGDTVRLVRFGDANMSIKKDQPDRRRSFRARHKCDEKKSKLTELPSKDVCSFITNMSQARLPAR